MNNNREKITFDSMPSLLAAIAEKLDKIETKVNHLIQPNNEDDDKWMNVKQLSEYLPTHPAEQTIYRWTSNKYIPFYKKGKSITFLKSEIDSWLKDDYQKTHQEIIREANELTNNKRTKRKW